MNYTIRRGDGWYVVVRGQVAFGPYRWNWLAELVAMVAI